MLVCIPTFALIFTNISLIAIPEGNVVQIKINDEIVWEEKAESRVRTLFTNKGIPNYSTVTFTCLNPPEE